MENHKSRYDTDDPTQDKSEKEKGHWKATAVAGTAESPEVGPESLHC